MRVQVVSCDANPLINGMQGEVIDFDFLPFCGTSEADPLIAVRLDTGVVESMFLSDVRLVRQ